VSSQVIVPPKSTVDVRAELAGLVPLRGGWYRLDVGRQPMANPDRVRIVVEVREGWEIDRAPRMRRISPRRVSVSFLAEESTTLRVRIRPAPGAWDLWDRLDYGV
jgi:hypothetical protein